jgi:hypothetical protein
MDVAPVIAIAGALASAYFGSRWGATQALRVRDVDNRREASDALWAYWLALHDHATELYSREEQDGFVPVSQTDMSEVAAARKAAARHARGLRPAARDVVLRPFVPDYIPSLGGLMDVADGYSELARRLEAELEREFGDRTWTRDGATLRWLRGIIKARRRSVGPSWTGTEPAQGSLDD